MRRFAAIFLPLLVVLLLALWRARGPEPKAANAPDGEFSAARATTVLRALLAEEVPHPIGSAANARVRDRIVARFRSLGYDTNVQRRFACNALPSCGMVENIIASRAGGTPAPQVVLVAHYDSVGAGPGASDDGVGVASLLEIARATSGERHRNPLVFLITDGEEAGLLGAEAFVADEALSRNAKVMINVENRGTYGPSNMFETSRHNRWLIRRLASSLERPHATSFFYAIYNLLPNDTDVTVFKRAGKAAINFAAIGGVNWYHTPLDNLAHVSARTLQHHGDNLLAAARAMADADLDAQSGDDASYFDVLQFFLIWWPAGATVWICAASLLLLLFAARKNNARAMTFGVLATFTAILVALFAGGAISWLARRNSAGINWVAHPQPSIAALWLMGIAAALCAAALFRKRSDERAMLFGAALVWHAIAFVLAITLTGVSFLFLVPALAFTICALARASDTTIAAVSATAASVVFFPILVLLYDALGGRMMAAIAILIGILFTLIAPLFASFRLAGIAAALAVVAAFIAMAVQATSAERPRAISLSYIDDATLSPVFVTPVLTPEISRAARFAPASPSLSPWLPAGVRQYSAPAPRMPIPRVEATATRNGDRVTVVMRSPRHAKRLLLAARGGTVARVNGVAPAPRSARFRDRGGAWRFAVVNGVEEATIELIAQGPIDIVAVDFSPGPLWPPLTRWRDMSPAMPQHDGDSVTTRVRLRK